MLAMNVGFHVVSPNLRLIHPTYLLATIAFIPKLNQQIKLPPNFTKIGSRVENSHACIILISFQFAAI